MNEQQRLDAAEYVLGTLDTDARVALERALLTDRKLAREKKGGQLCMEINNLVASTLDMALSRSKDTTGLTVLSDQGWHYKMQPYRAMFTHRGVTQNMSRKGNCFDNAVIESFLGTLKAVYFHLAKLDGLHDLEAGVNDYIHYYNYQRIKLGLKGLSPVEYQLKNTA